MGKKYDLILIKDLYGKFNFLIYKNIKLLPLYIVETFDADGLFGLFFVFLFSGVLSTISSGLNGLTAVALEDIIKKFIVKDLSEKNAAQLSKVLCNQILFLFKKF